MLQPIEALLRSEMLDERTCEICMDLDGVMLPVDDARWNGELGSLAHPNCRAIFVPIYDKGTMDYTPESVIPDIFLKQGALKLVDDWEDLPSVSRGAKKLAEKTIDVDEMVELLMPYEVIGVYLGLGEE